MPELPEITVIASQMRRELCGKTVAEAESRQPKNLNMPVAQFVETVKGKIVREVTSKGKWIFLKLEPSFFLLINLGMYGELLYYVNGQKLPERYQFKLRFSDGSGFTIFFSWFGYVHLVAEKDLKKHRLTANLGANPLSNDFCFERFKNWLSSKKKTKIKNFLLDQKNIAGIGNVYVQDILFQSRLHPNREISTLSQKEKQDLYNAIKDVLNLSIQHGGLAYEKDFYGQNGKFDGTKFLVGYKEGKPCPVCGTIIEKIKTRSTSSYICPSCQR
ncbi:Fpg/Nei family DNA glycosylase [Candidatus Bathyarchaeota archaeon]|nr:Fpg/Nei family DNA glycosylase [Candidatus Bathyarchaeota archaeon]